MKAGWNEREKRPKRARREMRRASREIETRERVRKDDKIRHNTVRGTRKRKIKRFK